MSVVWSVDHNNQWQCQRSCRNSVQAGGDKVTGHALSPPLFCDLVRTDGEDIDRYHDVPAGSVLAVRQPPYASPSCLSP